MKGWGLLAGMTALGALALGAWFFSLQTARTGIVITVRDALSGAPVWNSTVRLERWEVKSFAARSLRLTPMLPGRHLLLAKAPGYLPASERVAVKLGRVTSAAPLSLVGYEIPGLRGFSIAAERDARGLLVRLAPIGDAGRLIREFPCVDLRIILRVFIQVENGTVATAPTGALPDRGAPLFDGMAGWRWDSSPGSVFRYRALVRSDRLSSLPAPFAVVEALVLVPDPRKIGDSELDRAASELQAIDDRSEISAIERRYDGRIKIYRAVEWNVANS